MNIENIYKKLSWYPWLCSVIEGWYSGELKDNRFPIQNPKEKPLSIILNGPSIKTTIQYLNRKKMDVMMVSYSPETSLYSELKPEYFCYADPFFSKKSKRNREWASLIKKNNDSVMVFCPHYLKNKGYISENKYHVRGIYTPKSPWNYDNYSIKLLKNNLMVPYLINIGIFALYVGIQLGYKNIDLYGADFSNIKNIRVNEQNRIWYCDEHYYDKTVRFIRTDMKEEMRCNYLAYCGYKIISKYAKSQNVKITNMSDNSWIDCFPRYIKEEKLD